MSVSGAIDHLHANGASGWAFERGAGTFLVVEAVLLGRVVGEATADRERPDLAAVGFGSGLCGFDMAFYHPIEAELLPFVCIRPQGCNVELPRTNLTGFIECFAAMHARFPRAGRFRSIVGGLWTDRSDASGVLEGKSAIGSVAPETAGLLRDLIEHGFVRIPHLDAPSAEDGMDGYDGPPLQGLVDMQTNPKAREALIHVLGFFSRRMILGLLRAIFEDNPLICRTEVMARGAFRFAQASTLEAVPSPAECALLLSGLGARPCEIDIVVGSHALPEFSVDGRSRWLERDASAAVEIALQNGASVRTAVLNQADVMLVGPGTLYRPRLAEHARLLACLAVPSRQTPFYLLTRSGQSHRLSHPTGAALVA